MPPVKAVTAETRTPSFFAAIVPALLMPPANVGAFSTSMAMAPAAVTPMPP
jgi:hypothetical protein